MAGRRRFGLQPGRNGTRHHRIGGTHLNEMLLFLFVMMFYVFLLFFRAEHLWKTLDLLSPSRISIPMILRTVLAVAG